ncbi:MAG: copper-binding protein [Polyangiaceae bacterium]
MRRLGSRSAAHASFLCVLVVATPTIACSKRGESTELHGPRTYHAVGVIRAFGPGRAFVNIAHEDIAGYMKAMTMSFEPQRAGQLDGFVEHDRVDFDFIETEDARRVLTRIGKRP